MKKWDLTQFYNNDEEWLEDLKLFEPLVDQLASFKGKLDDFNNFKSYHELETKTEKLLFKLYAYIHLASDLNLKDGDKAQKNQQIMILLNTMSQKLSFVSPEIINLGKDKVFEFLDKDDFLNTFRFNFEKLFNQQEHVLSDIEEKILSSFGPLGNVGPQLYQSLSIVDAKDEEITLSNGKKQVVTLSNYRSLIPEVETKEDRKLVFEAAFKRYKDNKTSFAHIYNLVLQNRKSNYTSRNFNSHLEQALNANQIPLSVFHNLKDSAYENTDIIKKYISLRKKHLNLDEYRTYDRFLKLVTDNTKYPYEEAKELFFNSLKGYDNEFVNMQKEALASGFVDVLPQDGKRTGAYSSGFYGYHPYILLNHDESLDSVFTLAHEAGHSAHTLFSNNNQPMPTSNYTIFVAEIASTFNEHILLDYLVKNATSKNQKIALLETAIDGIMGTFFRQTLFATYEFEASEMVRKGIPLTESSLSEIMINLYKHYYDLDITLEDGKQYVWAYIPHLYRTPFYVYQYATSYSASLKIYEDVKNNKENAMENYLNLLKSGGSDYPVKQVLKAGVDLTTKEPFESVIRRFESLVSELEKTLNS